MIASRSPRNASRVDHHVRRRVYPPGHSHKAYRYRPLLELMEVRTLLSTFLVSSTSDSGPGTLVAIVDSHDAIEDLERQMENAFERELLELAMLRVEKRVKPTTWEAFRLTYVENMTGAAAASKLDIQPSHVFVAKHRVLKLLEAEVRKLKAARG